MKDKDHTTRNFILIGGGVLLLNVALLGVAVWVVVLVLQWMGVL